MNGKVETIHIGGMSCGHCVAAVRRALGAVDGVNVHEVTIGSAAIEYEPGSVDRAAIDGAIEDAGFSVVTEPAS